MSISKVQFMEYFVEQARNGNVSLFLGAGISSSVGLPSWAVLLEPCAEQMGVQISNNMDLYLLAQYYANEYGYSALKRVINNSINKLSDSSTLVDKLLELNFKSIWTTNYDKVIENNLMRKNILTNSIYDDKDLSNTVSTNRVNIYKMNGDIANLDRIVITQKDIESYHEKHEMLLTFFKRELVINSFLFLGYSFTDEIVLSCLAAVNRCLEESANYHFTIMKKRKDPDFLYFVKDLEIRYHIRVLLIEDYDELPEILYQLRESINKKNIFFSGVFERLAPLEDSFAENFLKELTSKLLMYEYHIYTGYGRNFGNYLSGSSIQYMFAHNMEINRYLIMRPFLQTMDQEEKKIHRNMLISECKFCIFMFGQSPKNGIYMNSSGMLKEYELAKQLGKVIIPIGCTGYSTAEIWYDVKSHITSYPYLEKYIDILAVPIDQQDINQLVNVVLQILSDCL